MTMNAENKVGVGTYQKGKALHDKNAVHVIAKGQTTLEVHVLFFTIRFFAKEVNARINCVFDSAFECMTTSNNHM